MREGGGGGGQRVEGLESEVHVEGGDKYNVQHAGWGKGH